MSVLSAKILRMSSGYFRLCNEHPNQLYVGRKEYEVIKAEEEPVFMVDLEGNKEYLGMKVNVLDKDNHVDIGVY